VAGGLGDLVEHSIAVSGEKSGAVDPDKTVEPNRGAPLLSDGIRHISWRQSYPRGLRDVMSIPL
jgi:hypothetical protein